MTEESAATPAARRTLRVITLAGSVFAVAYSVFWAVICFPQLNALAATHEIAAPPVAVVTTMAGPATDTDLAIGTGPEATGPDLSLLLAVSGRRVALDDLSG
ncbi:hypothetical protein ACFRQM_48130, partial [Streptomyces sp. NPDC056831]